MTVNDVYATSNGETGIYVISKGVVTITETESNHNSANYYGINYGQWWSDNLSDDQVWFFNGVTDDEVTIEVASGRFNPNIWIIDPEGGDGGLGRRH